MRKCAAVCVEHKLIANTRPREHCLPAATLTVCAMDGRAGQMAACSLRHAQTRCEHGTPCADRQVNLKTLSAYDKAPAYDKAIMCYVMGSTPLLHPRAVMRAAARSVQRGARASRRHGPVPLPQVHHRSCLGQRCAGLTAGLQAWQKQSAFDMPVFTSVKFAASHVGWTRQDTVQACACSHPLASPGREHAQCG